MCLALLLLPRSSTLSVVLLRYPPLFPCYGMDGREVMEGKRGEGEKVVERWRVRT